MRLFPFSICWLFSHKEARNKHCLLQHSASSFSSHLIYWRMEIISGPDTYCSTQYNPENSFFLQIRLSTSCWTFSVIEFLTTNFVKLSEQNIYLSIKISMTKYLSQTGVGRTVWEVAVETRVGDQRVRHDLLIASDNVSLIGNLPPSSQHLKLCWRECKVSPSTLKMYLWMN